MKTWKEYSSLHFPEGYIKVGDCIDIDLAVQLTDRERDAYDEYEDWDEGIIQGKHPVDVIGGKGVYETICRENVYTPFRYLGQCYAGESTNRNPAPQTFMLCTSTRTVTVLMTSPKQGTTTIHPASLIRTMQATCFPFLETKVMPGFPSMTSASPQMTLSAGPSSFTVMPTTLHPSPQETPGPKSDVVSLKKRII